MKIHKCELPLKEDLDMSVFEKGDVVYISGYLFVMRDRAHRKYLEEKCTDLNFRNGAIFYAGPTEKGIIGPTTSARMDKYTEDFIRLGVRMFIGKGERDPELMKRLKEQGVVYGSTFGGLAAYLTQKVERLDAIKYEELVCEGIHLMKVKNFPVIVK